MVLEAVREGALWFIWENRIPKCTHMLSFVFTNGHQCVHPDPVGDTNPQTPTAPLVIYIRKWKLKGSPFLLGGFPFHGLCKGVKLPDPSRQGILLLELLVPLLPEMSGFL